MVRSAALAIAILSLGSGIATADDHLGLKRGANGNAVTISGVSSGAAMAVQYAVAHSQSIVGVGSIAGPPHGIAPTGVSLGP